MLGEGIIREKNDGGYNCDSPKSNYVKPCVGIARGDIWKVRVNRLTGVGYGTFIVVSGEEENSEKPYVIMVNVVDSLNGKPRASRFSIQLGNETKYVVCETIKRVDSDRLVEYIGKLSPDETNKLNSALAYTMGLDISNDSDSFYKDKYESVKHDLQSLIDSLDDNSYKKSNDSENITSFSCGSGGYTNSFKGLI